ncbi:hypothetical protein ILYODFUR_003723 [Ilyodon furcidens]|uniref:Uncharacterized protein n=1 Tax=Ilyodon furcidens TaxID=33524 RepID=A0ABV0VAT1_9TELE
MEAAIMEAADVFRVCIQSTNSLTYMLIVSAILEATLFLHRKLTENYIDGFSLHNICFDFCYPTDFSGSLTLLQYGTNRLHSVDLTGLNYIGMVTDRLLIHSPAKNV